jgi:protein SCO1
MKPVIAITLLPFLLYVGCGNKSPVRKNEFVAEKLPRMGPLEVLPSETGDGWDTIYHKIPSFEFINQFGEPFTQENLQGKVYLADFFFTTCPTICPKMTETMKRVHDAIQDFPGVHLLSHTIDPFHDTPEVLREYGNQKGANFEKWTFLTGDLDAIYEICEFGYMAYAKEAPDEPGGFTHSGFLVLIDKNKHIRAVYDGTRIEIAPEIVADIQTLLSEPH